MTFALSPAESKASELKPLIQAILAQSKDPVKNTQIIKALFLDCEKNCKDPTLKEASQLINTNFDKDYWITKIEEKTELLSYVLLEVVDGDTLKVQDSTGKEQSIRMIGLDTPESHPTRFGYIECYGAEASAHLKSLLQGVSQIQLETDFIQGTSDKYGRLLGYVRSNGVNLNQKMIEDWFGFEYTYNLPYKYQSEFKSTQKIASEKKLGLWADATCKGERKTISEKEEKKPDPKGEKIYHLWPKGGCYYFTEKGDKEYVDKAFCR